MATADSTPDRSLRALVLVCAIVMLVGAGLRFVRLDAKIFGNDEATTSVHVSGHTIAQFGVETFDGRPRTADELLAYQRPDPKHGLRDVAASLAIEDPQHPPLYYVLERQWELGAGSSLASRRTLSAIFGVASIAAAIWLGIELWSLAAGVIMGALVAASPFAIAYAQVAREYSLWIALTFASTALFVRAIRTESAIWWTVYAACAIAGLYTDTLYAIVVVAHAIALPFASPKRMRASFIGFGAASLAMLIAYAPWIAILRAGFGHGLVTNNTFLGAGLPLKLFALKWIFNIGTLFYDADYVMPKTVVLALPGFVVLIASAVACVRATKRRPSLEIVLVLAIVPFLALVLPDLLHHQQRSTASRYLVPLWVAAYTMLGVGLAIAFEAGNRNLRAAASAFVAFTALTGFGSFYVSSEHTSWWVDGSASLADAPANAIAHSREPLVLWHATWGPGAPPDGAWDFTPMILANIVPAQTRFALFPNDEAVTIPKNDGTTLALEPTDDFLADLRARGERPSEIAVGTIASASSQVKAMQHQAQADRARHGASLATTVTLWELAPK